MSADLSDPGVSADLTLGVSVEPTTPATGAAPHALVTGGARGIGAAISRRLLAAGMRVTLLGRSRDTLDAAIDDLRGTGIGDDRLTAVVADVGDDAQVQAAFEAARRHHGPITVLVNNAGQALSTPFAKLTGDAWHDMLRVNLDGVFFCSQAALPDMLAAGWGRIVNVASTAGLVGYRYVSAYCAAKHGVIGLTRSLALELASKGITVNAVCPGYTETDLVRSAIDRIVSKTGRSVEQARAELAAGNPQGRLVSPEEVADTVDWLCRSGASAITGQSIAVAGGEVM